MILRRIPFLLSLLTMVNAACEFTMDTIAPTNKLTDLRQPTPFTFVDDYRLASCGAKATVATVYVTIWISGTAYPAATAEKYVMGAATQGAVTWEFPGLMVSDLLPGQVATVSWSAVNGLNGGNMTAAFLITVPKKITLTAIHSATTIVSSSVSSASSASSAASGASSIITSDASSIASSASASASATSTSTSSAPIGGIVAGVICGLVIITAILAFTYFKVKTHRDKARDIGYHEMLDFDSYSAKPLSYPEPAYTRDVKMTMVEGEDGRAIPYRIPAESANTSREY